MSIFVAFICIDEILIEFTNKSYYFTAQFQTMNIGTLGQPNVVTIQHQGTICDHTFYFDYVHEYRLITYVCIRRQSIWNYIFFSVFFFTDIIQHPQSNVVTLPATILTATVAGAPGPGVTVPPPGVHIPPHSGPLVPPTQPQVLF